MQRLTSFLKWLIDDIRAEWVYPRKYRDGDVPAPMQWVLLEAVVLYITFLMLSVFFRMAIDVIPMVRWEWI